MEAIDLLMTLPGDFPYEEVIALGQKVTAAGVLVPGFVPSAAGLLDPFAIQFDQTFERKEHHILPDRNLTSRIARIGLGEAVEDEQRKLAASLMALAQCFNWTFEPAIAFHELGFCSGNDIAHEELTAFRIADESRPQVWVDLAVGRRSALERVALEPLVGPPLNFAKPLHRWRRNYAIALKIAELELCSAPPIDKLMRLLEWMHQDFLIGGPALLLASLYFSPTRRSGTIKGIRAHDREKAIAGVKNAAWDITHLSDFIRRVLDNDQSDGPLRFIFATLDRELARTADSLFHLADEQDDLEKFATRLKKWWPSGPAYEIANAFLDAIERRDEPERLINHERPKDVVTEYIASGEARLLQWRPN